MSASPAANRDKIRCLDGLRGIACLIVFNYHFLWPWTPTIMLGYGALPPRSPEPSWELPSLPILCLLHRGRPMVAIFFAISGYVLCRHILRSIHERRLDVAYQKLASAVFRRVFRLYIPPTISMFLVALLAQMGAFRSEFDVYKGPDSVYINATVSKIELNTTCGNWSVPVAGAAGMADYLGLQSPMYLNNISTWNETICLNVTSRSFGPSMLYLLEEPPKVKINDTAANETFPDPDLPANKNRLKNMRKSSFNKPAASDPVDNNATEGFNLTWVQLGGSWEEHPFIHDNMTYALKNFTRAYAEWVNPFNFGHYHPRYDPHTFTIPMELRGSMLVYLFLLGTAALQYKWRFRLAGLLSAYSLTFGRWDMAAFLGGALLSEMDIRASDGHDRTLAPPSTGPMRSHHQSKSQQCLRFVGFFVALYFLSYPDAGAEWTPGFVFLSSLVPKYYIPLSGWMFYQSMGALILLPCILRTPSLRELLEGPTAQYLGKISFSLYLVHGPILHSLGFWIMPRLFERLGRTAAFALGYVMLMSVTLYVADWWYRKIDVWSTTVGRRVERYMMEEK